VHQLVSLAEDMLQSFDALLDVLPDELTDLAEYF
jgi:hypothetical protein